MVRTLAFVVLVLATQVLTSACLGTGASSAGSGQRIIVRLYDAKSSVRLEMANESHPDLRDVYSTQRDDAALKLAPDELMGDLVRDLDRLKFTEFSQPGVPPAGGVRGWVEVYRDGAARTFVVPSAGASAEVLTSFGHMKQVLSYYYSHIGGLQFIENPDGAAIFRGQP